MKKILISVILFTVLFSLYAEDPALNIKSLKKLKDNSFIMQLKKNSNKDSLKVIAQLKKAYELEDNFTFREMRKNKDSEGFFHTRFVQKYKDVEIEGAEIILHEDERGIQKITGKIHKDFYVNVHPFLSGKHALSIALELLPSDQYMWELDDNDFFKKLHKGEITGKPEPVLKIVKDDNSGNYQLAYRIDVYSNKPAFGYAVYVNAITGVVISRIPLFNDSSVAGSGTTLFDGTQTIYLTWDPGISYYKLYDEDRNIYTTFTSSSGDTSIPLDSDTTWTALSQKKYVSAHWGTYQTYKYYLNTFNRNSYDDNGSPMHIDLNYTYTDNASWNGVYVKIGRGLNKATDYLATLDIIGHEWTHGVVQDTANLQYWNESGALNESFADIFGVMVEFYSSSGNYQIAEDVWIEDGKMRDMSNPNSKGDPDTYLGNYWVTGGGDNGGVHTNSSVQNYWFYLLAQGGSGTNDNNDSYAIIGIGRDKAAAIAYRSLNSYLTSTSQYADAREYSMEAAKDLYGEPSFEVVQTANAWYAAGVGDEYYHDLVRKEVENNDSSSYADGPLSAAIHTRAVIGTSSDQDWYYFDMPQAGTITITLYEAYKSWTLYKDPAQGSLTSGSTGTKSYNITSTGRYYLKFTGYTGHYYFTIAGNSGSTAKFEIEGNNESSNADGFLSSGRPVSGKINSSSDTDWYYFKGYANNTITIALNGSYKSWALYQNPAQNFLTTGNAGTKSYTLPASGKYFLKLTGYEGTYDFTVTGSLGASLYEVERNNTYYDAGELPCNNSYALVAGKINDSADLDWYYFDVNTVTYLTITLSGDYKSWALYSDPAGNFLISKTSGTNTYVINTPGRYYLKLSGYAGSYDFSITDM